MMVMSVPTSWRIGAWRWRCKKYIPHPVLLEPPVQYGYPAILWIYSQEIVMKLTKKVYFSILGVSKGTKNARFDLD